METCFVWKGKDPGGNLRCREIIAENAQQAKARLRAEGWSDLQLVVDEIGDAAGRFVEQPKALEEFPDQLTPEDKVDLLEGRKVVRFGFWAQYAQTIRQTSWTAVVILVFLLVYGLHRGKTWPMIVGAGGLALLIFLYPILYIFVTPYFSLPSKEYARLNDAKVWSRWDEVLKSVERLRRIRRLTHMGPGEVELIRCRAQALAATGRLEEGLKEFSQFERAQAVPRWMYLSFLAGIYDCAKEFQKALACRREAVAEKSDTSVVWIDLAYGLVRGLNHPVEAREALARAEQLEINRLGQAYLPFLRGIICWREGKYLEAKGSLETAIQALQAFAHAPLAEGLVLLAQSYLCAAHVGLGEINTAQDYYRRTERFLIAAREEELLKFCRPASTACATSARQP